MELKKAQKNAEYFNCDICDFQCYKKSDYDRHLSTRKHQVSQDGINLELNGIKKNAAFICICQKRYKTQSGLWKHKRNGCKKTPFTPNHTSEIKPIIDKDLLTTLVKENSELKNMMIEQQSMMLEFLKNGINTTTTTNSHNKTFNLQVFLNETCKDAMNITEFIDSINLQLSDLEKVGEVGYVEGISNIIVKNLKALDITQRPVHCTDKKREILYIKDENKWEKENDENYRIRNVIKKVSSKNIKLLKDFREKYPDCNKSESYRSDQYNKLIIEAMGGKGDNDFEKENKIIKNIAKEIIIEK